MNALSPPRWSVTYPVTGRDTLISKGVDVEEVAANIVVNPSDFPPAATRLSLALAGLYTATVGNAMFRIRTNGTPAFSDQPSGDVAAVLVVVPTASPTVIPDLVASIEMPSSPILVQVTMQQLNSGGEVTMASAQLSVNGF